MGSSKYKKLIEENSYYNKELKFYIEKPERWIFVPQDWSNNFKEKSLASACELKQRLSKASLPFIYFYKPHDNPRYPFPCVKCVCRLKSGVSKTKFTDLAGIMIREFARECNNFKIIQPAADYIISGHRGVFIRNSFTIKNHYGKPVEYLGRMIIVDGVKFVYMIALTGSVEGEYCCEDEFSRSIQSIEIR